MALRDELNVPLREELYDFVLAEGQAITVLGDTVLGDIAAELWYFDSNSTATDNGVTVIQPTAIPFNNPGRYLLWIYNSDWNYLENKPSFSTVATSGNYNDLSNLPAIPSNTSQITEGSNLYYTDARARSAISITTTGTSGAATYSSSTGILNIPNYTTPTAPTINSNVSRSLSNAAGSTNQFTISTSQNARVYYSINVAWSITALVSTASTVLLEYSTNGGSSWVIVNQVSRNLNLGIILSGNDDLNVSGEIPANALVRIRPSVATNATITYVRGQEILY